MAYGLVGPIARAAGVDYDVRKYFPYLGYDTYDFNVPVADRGRRLRALPGADRRDAREREDLPAGARADHAAPAPFAIDDPRITPPPKDRVYTEMEALIQHFLDLLAGLHGAGRRGVRAGRGPARRAGLFVVSDGTNRPWRIKSRAPSLLACQALERMIVGGLIADVIAVIGSIDVVMGDVDR